MKLTHLLVTLTVAAPSAFAIPTSTTIVQSGVSIAIAIGDGIGLQSASATTAGSSETIPTSTVAIDTINTEASISSSAAIVVVPTTSPLTNFDSTTALDASSTTSILDSSLSSDSITSITTSSDTSTSSPASGSMVTPPPFPSTGHLTHEVEVGNNSELAFQPPVLNATVGDVIIFRFHPLNHSLTESTRDDPCVPLVGGFDTGFHQYSAPDDALDIVAFTVHDPNPRYFFCQQSELVSHCQSGMLFALNAGIDDIQARNAKLDSPQSSSATSTSFLSSTPTTLLTSITSLTVG